VEASHPGDGLRKVLRRWLKHDVAYWSVVLKALISVGEQWLASELKVKYGKLATTESLRVCIDDVFNLYMVEINGPIISM